MATTYPVTLQGGPCDGRTLQVSAATLSSGRVACGGVTYRYVLDSHDPWIFQSSGSGVTGPPTPGGVSAGALSPSSLHGWSQLRWTVNHAVPGAIRTAQRLNRATLANLRGTAKGR